MLSAFSVPQWVSGSDATAARKRTSFLRAAEVWAFAGFDPITDGSGDRPDRVGRLSKRGDPAFRDGMYLMSYHVAQNYAPVSLTFLDAFDRGKCEVEATIHAAHRVNRICFHLMQQDEPFVDQSTPAQRAECARRWRQFRTEKKRRRSRRKRGKRRR
jgi:hypothetical protein